MSFRLSSSPRPDVSPTKLENNNKAMPDFADVKRLLNAPHDPLAVWLGARLKSFDPLRILETKSANRATRRRARSSSIPATVTVWAISSCEGF